LERDGQLKGRNQGAQTDLKMNRSKHKDVPTVEGAQFEPLKNPINAEKSPKVLKKSKELIQMSSFVRMAREDSGNSGGHVGVQPCACLQDSLKAELQQKRPFRQRREGFFDLGTILCATASESS
jgi:hypothetical protein